MDPNLRTALDRIRELNSDLEYYATVNDLLQAENEELREALKSAKGQLALKSLEITFPANVA